MSKRYYWLKLKEDFFRSKEIKKLRNLAGGDTYTVIYLKMQLLAMKTDGFLWWTGLEESFAEELALDLDEKPDDVKVTLAYLLKTGLAEAEGQTGVFLPAVLENTGSEQESARRVREYRKRQGLLQCNAEKETEIQSETETESEREGEGRPPRAAAFAAPTVEEVAAYCRERGNAVDPQAFVDYYSGTGWFRGKTRIRDWKACVRTWEQRGRETPTGGKRKQFVTAAEYRPPEAIDAGRLAAVRDAFGCA